jgi:pheromone a factor receptor
VHQPLGIPHSPTFSFGRGLWSSVLSPLAMGVSYPLSTTSSSNLVLLRPVFTIRAVMKRRKLFKDIVIASSNLTYSNYWRLVALASVDFCFTIPLAIWVIVGNATWGEVSPWVSWADTHWGYSRVFQFPRVVLNETPVVIVSLEITRWAVVLCAFVFFGFFGFADEAKENYRLLISTVAERLGCKRVLFNSSSDQLSTMSFSKGGVSQIPESVLDLASVGRSSVTDIPKSVYPDNTFDRA